MVVGEIPESVDLLVVGGGPGGYTAAIRASQLGRDVTLVDKAGASGLGGTCLNVGCIPSKALIETAEIRHRAHRFSAAGLSASPVPGTKESMPLHFSMEQWQDWKTGVVDKLSSGVGSLLKSAGVTVKQGDLHFTRRNQAVLETDEGTAQYVQFKDVILATGSRPSGIPSVTVDGASVHDSTSLLNLKQLPDSLLVAGGGTIGLELGTAFAKLGTEVTIVEGLDHILGFAEPSVRQVAISSLKSLGIKLLTGAKVDSYDGNQAVVIHGNEHLTISAESVLVATGRQPNTDDLGLENLGVNTTESGHVEVGADRLAKRHVAAIGDIVEGPALAHKATAEAVVAAEALSGDSSASYEPAAIPVVVFSDPEIAVVGISTSEAKRDGLNARSVKLPLAASGRAATMLEGNSGVCELIAEEDTGVVLGVQIASPHASELIGQAVTAIEMGTTVEDLAEIIMPHPTISEQLHDAAHLWLGSPLVVPAGKK